MLALAIIGVVLAFIGIGATVYVAFLVDRRTTKLIHHIEAVLIAQMTPDQYQALIRAVDDIEKSGKKQAGIFLGADGKWHVAFERTVMAKIGIKTS